MSSTSDLISALANEKNTGSITTKQIENAYITFFNRPADFAGLNYWLGYKGNLVDLYNTFSKSQEYTALFSNKSNAEIVQTVYQNLFGRAPEAAGQSYWADQLNRGTLNIGTVANAICSGAQSTDKTAVDSKVTAATTFTSNLDTTAKQAAYASLSSTGLNSIKSWLATVTSSSGLVSALNTAGDVINSLQGSSGSQSTYSLTATRPNISEGNSGTTNMVFDLTLDHAASSSISVTYQTLSTGTATPNVDFVSASGTVTFAAGSKTASVSVAIKGDTTYEANESVAIQFSGTKLTAPITVTGTITNDDASASTTGTTTGTGTTTPSTGSSQVVDIRSASNGADSMPLKTYDAGTGAKSFVIDINKSHPVDATTTIAGITITNYNDGSRGQASITNFGSDDSIQISNQSLLNIFSKDSKNVVLNIDGSNGHMETVTLMGANPNMATIYDLNGFNALPVGDIKLTQATAGTGTTTDSSTTSSSASTSSAPSQTIDIRSASNGSDAMPMQTYDASGGAKKFTVDINKSHPVDATLTIGGITITNYSDGSFGQANINNFGADDSIQISNHILLNIYSKYSTNVLLTVSGNDGHSEMITLVGVNPGMATIYDLNGFNALAVGDISL
ncbi:DUF4214 domain-containing protein [Dechloromonas sp. ZY10]|uniref:DUF4214 domain-containing protein n=1 Tax=Dechloromonas aquae TaxID=2664436 RepID=UPI003529ABF0